MGDNQYTSDEFIRQNMGLVYSVAKKYSAFCNAAMDYDDLVAMGSQGLIKACRKFDPSYGLQFSTYAVPTIMGEIKRFLRDDYQLIKFSRHDMDAYQKAKKAGVLDEDKEIISQVLGISLEEAEYILKLKPVLLGVVELDATVSDKDDRPRDKHDIMNLDSSPDTYSAIEDRLVISGFIDTLNDSDRHIIETYLNNSNCSQVELGEILGMSQVQASRRLKKIYALAHEYGKRQGLSIEGKDAYTGGQRHKTANKQKTVKNCIRDLKKGGTYMANSPFKDNIIKLIGEGKTNEEICKELECKVSTVKYIRENLKIRANQDDVSKKVPQKTIDKLEGEEFSKGESDMNYDSNVISSQIDNKSEEQPSERLAHLWSQPLKLKDADIALAIQCSIEEALPQFETVIQALKMLNVKNITIEIKS